ncbi:MAG: DUF2202 domain-containing protein [Actinomycetota bacterium]|nr:DUF2202 domain-containing protein [Actinomycetota bacterium]
MKVKARSSQALLLGAVALVAVISVAAVAVGATSDADIDTTSSASTVEAIQASAASLTEAEIEGIMFMREEEKLAYDVYTTFADLHGQPIFSNIASAEMQHMTAVLGVIEANDLEDPVDGSPIGVFVNDELQKLYDDLIEAGSVDLASALEVGAIIEEVDILDLEDYLARTTNGDLIRVYGNLLRGSENHLRAFVSQLESAGIDREPYVMDAGPYEAILTSAMERGGGSPGSGHDSAGHGDGECDESGEGRHEQSQHGQGQGGQGQHGQGQGGQGRHGQNG